MLLCFGPQKKVFYDYFLLSVSLNESPIFGFRNAVNVISGDNIYVK